MLQQLFKKLGSAGFLGVNRDPEYGGLGLDYSYAIALAEEYGNIRAGGVGMAIGVQSGKMKQVSVRTYLTLSLPLSPSLLPLSLPPSLPPSLSPQTWRCQLSLGLGLMN